MSSQIEKSAGLVYVNSFLKQQGNDYNFVVDLPSLHCTQMSLVGCYMDVVLPNLYKTTGHDFSQFGIQVGGVTVQYTCNVYINSLAEFVLWWNTYSPRYKLQQQVVAVFMKVFSFRVQDSSNANAYVNASLVGEGWVKLGFSDFTAKQTHTGSGIADLSLSPSIQIRINDPVIKNNITSNVGSSHFSVPLISSFGSKLMYDLQGYEQARNTIYFDRLTTISRLGIEMLNCDFHPLYSCDYGRGINNNDLEVILVFAIKKPA